MKLIRSWIETAFYKPQTKTFLVVNDFLAILTVGSVLALALETVNSLAPYQFWFTAIEYTAVFFFTLEYLARIFVYKRSRHYIFSFFGLIDLLSILPTYIMFTNLTFLKAARVLRILRFMRMVRLAKLARLSQKGGSRQQVRTLNFQIYFFALFSALVLFGTLLYVVEGSHTNAANIPLAMLWIAKVIMGGVAQTMPETVWGDVIIVTTRFTGLLLFGLLVYVIGDTLKRTLFGNEKLVGEY